MPDPIPSADALERACAAYEAARDAVDAAVLAWALPLGGNVNENPPAAVVEARARRDAAWSEFDRLLQERAK